MNRYKCHYQSGPDILTAIFTASDFNDARRQLLDDFGADDIIDIILLRRGEVSHDETSGMCQT